MDLLLLGILLCCLVAPSIGQPPVVTTTTTTTTLLPATTTTTTVAATTTTTIGPTTTTPGDPALDPAPCTYDSDCSPVYRTERPRLVCKNGSCFDCTRYSTTRYCIDHQSSQNARITTVAMFSTVIFLLVILPVCVGCYCFFCPGCPVYDSHAQRGHMNGEIMFIMQREVIRSARNSRQESLGTGPNAISGQTEGSKPNPDTKVAIEGDK